jgi:Glutamate-cysteine ligase
MLHCRARLSRSHSSPITTNTLHNYYSATMPLTSHHNTQNAPHKHHHKHSNLLCHIDFSINTDDTKPAAATMNSCEEMTMDEIFNGKGKYYPGLIPLVYAYLDYIRCFTMPCLAFPCLALLPHRVMSWHIILGCVLIVLCFNSKTYCIIFPLCCSILYCTIISTSARPPLNATPMTSFVPLTLFLFSQ